MSQLWPQCHLLRASLEQFLDEQERISVWLRDSPRFELTSDWHTWTGWVDEPPTPLVLALVNKSRPLGNVLAAIRAIRLELAAPSWGSTSLRDGFRTVFEVGFVKQPWLKGAGILMGEFHQNWNDTRDDVIESQEWIFTANPLPVATLERLCAIAMELDLAEERHAIQGDERDQVAHADRTHVDAAALVGPLGSAPGHVLALGHVVPLPSLEMAELIQAMLEAFPGGIGIDAVRKKNSKGPVRLAALAKKDCHFAAAVALPGGARKGGYRIRSVAEAEALIATNDTRPPDPGGVPRR